MSFGVAGETARAMFKVLQEAEHHMKTGFGRLDQAYGNEPVPQQHSGQGNRMGPTLCLGEGGGGGQSVSALFRTV